MEDATVEEFTLKSKSPGSLKSLNETAVFAKNPASFTMS